MEPQYVQSFLVDDMAVDRFGYLKPSAILFYAQEVAGAHCKALALDYDTLAKRRMFWAVIRHRVQVTRMPKLGETIRVETWPMPTTRAAYPRSVVACDENGSECFRSISLWVLMDLDTRNMILPGKSGISVVGTIRGTELPSPNGLIAKPLGSLARRSVCFTDLDRNGHMNNTRYLDWVDDLLPSAFHMGNTVKEFTACYLSEAREGQELELRWDFLDQGCLQVDAYRHGEEKDDRIFSARIDYE